MAQRTLIKGGTVVAVDARMGDLDAGEVLVEGSAIVAVGPHLGVGDAAVVGAPDCIGLPGLIDTHRPTCLRR
jgi:5-methylthioadenosine/S-adenosylhomocysteine deaminase